MNLDFRKGIEMGIPILNMACISRYLYIIHILLQKVIKHRCLFCLSEESIQCPKHMQNWCKCNFFFKIYRFFLILRLHKQCKSYSVLDNLIINFYWIKNCFSGLLLPGSFWNLYLTNFSLISFPFASALRICSSTFLRKGAPDDIQYRFSLSTIVQGFMKTLITI